jgi:transposase-like protein
MQNETPRTLQQAVIYYSNPDNCRNDLVAARWPDGVICPTCGRDDVRYLENQRKWQCKSVHKQRQFSAKVGTIFEDSALGLDKWMTALWLIANAKNGISSCELARSVGVTQKSAWHMLHRIRLAMQNGSLAKLSGSVEVDETFIGGKARNMHMSRRKNLGSRETGKVAVMGLLERHGEVRTVVVSNTKRRSLHGQVNQHVEQGSVVYSDALRSYNLLGEDYIHNVINHAVEYVNGHIHTNGIENYWSLLKRALKGTYVSVEPFHLFRYLDEQSFRFNGRKQTDAQRFSQVLKQVVGKRLQYSKLVGQPS